MIRIDNLLMGFDISTCYVYVLCMPRAMWFGPSILKVLPDLRIKLTLRHETKCQLITCSREEDIVNSVQLFCSSLSIRIFVSFELNSVISHSYAYRMSISCILILNCAIKCAKSPLSCRAVYRLFGVFFLPFSFLATIILNRE